MSCIITLKKSGFNAVSTHLFFFQEACMAVVAKLYTIECERLSNHVINLLYIRKPCAKFIKIFKYCNTSVFHLMFISTYHLSLKKSALYRKTCLIWPLCNPPLCVNRHFRPFPMCFTLCNSKSCNFLSHNM